MRKLKLQVQVSIDGFIAGPNGEMDWMNHNWDQELIEYVGNLTEPVDCIVLGRVLAQGFIPHWTQAAIGPDAEKQDPLSLAAARKFYETPKIVFTKSLETHQWEHAELANSDLVEKITELKNQEGGDIIAYGGGNFVSNLIKNNLIDEYYLFVNPTILGNGMPIFQHLDAHRSMKLVSAQSFSSGIAVLCYAPFPTKPSG